MNQQIISGPSKLDAPLLMVFFDGVCILCNTFVEILLRIDSKKILRFASLQGETAKALGDFPLESLIVVEHFGSPNQKIFRASQAVFRIFNSLGGFWRIAGIFSVLPGWATDWLYFLIARNRYKLFGQRASCRIPSIEEQERFLS
jgi:predicted DCC family thiol-disulfide oxidoreductase YuxK